MASNPFAQAIEDEVAREGGQQPPVTPPPNPFAEAIAAEDAAPAASPFADLDAALAPSPAPPRNPFAAAIEEADSAPRTDPLVEAELSQALPKQIPPDLPQELWPEGVSDETMASISGDYRELSVRYNRSRDAGKQAELLMEFFGKHYPATAARVIEEAGHPGELRGMARVISWMDAPGAMVSAMLNTAWERRKGQLRGSVDPSGSIYDLDATAGERAADVARQQSAVDAALDSSVRDPGARVLSLTEGDILGQLVDQYRSADRFDEPGINTLATIYALGGSTLPGLNSQEKLNLKESSLQTWGNHPMEQFIGGGITKAGRGLLTLPRAAIRRATGEAEDFDAAIAQQRQIHEERFAEGSPEKRGRGFVDFAGLVAVDPLNFTPMPKIMRTERNGVLMTRAGADAFDDYVRVLSADAADGGVPAVRKAEDAAEGAVTDAADVALRHDSMAAVVGIDSVEALRGLRGLSDDAVEAVAEAFGPEDFLTARKGRGAEAEVFDTVVDSLHALDDADLDKVALELGVTPTGARQSTLDAVEAALGPIRSKLPAEMVEGLWIHGLKEAEKVGGVFRGLKVDVDAIGYVGGKMSIRKGGVSLDIGKAAGKRLISKWDGSVIRASRKLYSKAPALEKPLRNILSIGRPQKVIPMIRELAGKRFKQLKAMHPSRIRFAARAEKRWKAARHANRTRAQSVVNAVRSVGSKSTRQLATRYRELGYHSPLTESGIHGLAKLDEVEQVLAAAKDGTLSSVPVELTQGLEALGALDEAAAIRGVVESALEFTARREGAALNAAADELATRAQVLRYMLTDNMASRYALDAETAALEAMEPAMRAAQALRAAGGIDTAGDVAAATRRFVTEARRDARKLLDPAVDIEDAGVRGVTDLLDTKGPARKGAKNLVEEMGKTEGGREFLNLAKALGYDLRPNGVNKMLRELGSRSYVHQELAARKWADAEEAFRHARLADNYRRLPKVEQDRVLRALGDRRKFGVAKDASPEAKARGKALGLVGHEELDEGALSILGLLDKVFDDQLERLRSIGKLDIDKEAFLRRVDVEAYVPHMLRAITSRKVAALKGQGLLPRRTSLDYEKRRLWSGIADDINEQRRIQLAGDALNHEVLRFGTFGNEAVPEAVGAKWVEAANKGRLREVIDADLWDEAVAGKRDAMGLDGSFEFFETDMSMLVKRYMGETDRTVADWNFIDDTVDTFPLGRQIAERYPGPLGDLVAESLGYTRLSQFDWAQASTRVKLPESMRKHADQVTQRLNEGVPAEQIVQDLLDAGVDVKLQHVESFKLPHVYVPEQVGEYFRWLNSPSAEWGAVRSVGLGVYDGLTAAMKATATVAAHAHIAMNLFGNNVAMAQVTRAAMNPRNIWEGFWLAVADQIGSAAEREILVEVGGRHVKTTLRKYRDEIEDAGWAGASAEDAYAAEMLGLDVAQRAKGGMFQGLALQAAGATVGGLAGGPAGLMLGMIGAPFLGQQARYAARGGWKAVRSNLLDEVIDVWKEAGVKGITNEVAQRGAGAFSMGVIGSALGPAGMLAGAAMGALSFPDYIRLMGQLNSSVEAMSRITLGLARRREGATFAKAAEDIDLALRDYAAQTPFEGRVIRRTLFFSTWDLGNFRFQTRQLIRDPKQAAVFTSLVNGLTRSQFTEDEMAHMPEYLRWQLQLRTDTNRMVTMVGIPQFAAFELLARMDGTVPMAGLASRLNPMILTLVEAFNGKESVHFGRGWGELNNVRQLKDSPPALKWMINFPTGEGEGIPYAPVYERGRRTGRTQAKYRIDADHAERLYLLQRVPGYRVIREYMKLATDTFMSRMFDAGGADTAATPLDRFLSFGMGARPIGIDFEERAATDDFFLRQRLVDELNSQNSYAVQRYERLRPYWSAEPQGPALPGPEDDDQP